MTNGDRREYSREPLKAQDYANHREMYEWFDRRRWFREMADRWLKSAGILIPLLIALYTLWQTKGGR